MDPTIVVAVLEAATTIGVAIFEKWTGQPETDDSQIETSGALGAYYMDYRKALTEPMVTILHCLEISNYDMPVEHLRLRVYPDLILDPDILRKFDAEFKYRAEYIALLGCVHRIGTSEYAISHLGKAFLRRARQESDYRRVLS